MKHWLQLLCLVPSLAWGMTFESDRVSSLLPHVTSDTLVVFDVDETVMAGSRQLGSRGWSNHIRAKLAAAGYSDEQVEEHLHRFWVFVQGYTQYELMDPELMSVMSQLPHTIACTKRKPLEAESTDEQLAALGVHFTAPSETFTLTCPHPALYQNGIIYAGDNPKSVALQAYFAVRGATPPTLILLDDYWFNINDLERANLNTNYIGIRYSAIDAREAAFEADIADLQWSLLPAYLSDEEARAQLELSDQSEDLPKELSR
jgi:hypothetical protein